MVIMISMMNMVIMMVVMIVMTSWGAGCYHFNDGDDRLFFQVKNLQKKIQSTESAYDVCTEDMFNQVNHTTLSSNGKLIQL